MMNLRTLIFYDPTLPYPGLRPKDEDLAEWRDRAQVVDAGQLCAALASTDEPVESLLWLHGSYFPEAAWPDLVTYLEQGRGLVVMGGAPFRRACHRLESDWRIDLETPGYLQELGIHEVLPIGDDHQAAVWQANPDVPVLSNYASTFVSHEGDHVVLHGTPKPDHPHESGSSGPIDAKIIPLVTGSDDRGRARLASVVLIEHQRGRFAGGRWIFAHRLTDRGFWQDQGMAALDCLSAFAARGVVDFVIAPQYASYYLHESPTLTLSAENLRPGAGASAWTVSLTIVDADRPERPEWEQTIQLEVAQEMHTVCIPVAITLHAGLYQIDARLTRAPGEEVRLLHQGFWGYDADLLHSQDRLQAGQDYFHKGGQPFPVVGTTYMASDVARKFLFQPNPYVFDRDMAAIHNHALNFIRTGLWTAWRQAMFVDGRPNETVLRALDAFLLSANRHRLEVTFTFFSFTPETWEGENPYLDPRSVNAQKRVIAAIVERHRHTTNVQWDLINEPSLFDPKRIFQGPRSQHDPFEIAAYQSWLKARHGNIQTLRSRWGGSANRLWAFEQIKPPEPNQIPFDIQDVTANKHGRGWLDYALFTMDMFNRWAADLVSTIRALSPAALVTVGQDEALNGQRPSPLFYQQSVDYTTVHSWWLMDQLVWDGVFAKTALHPNLVQETGVMYLEQADGRAKRTESELADVLERKFAYAFGTRAAGAVQWIWNTNAYMHNLNESNIGALRADGTEKPEALVLEAFARFITNIGDWFHDLPLASVAVVYPYSNDLGHRRLSVEATTRLTQVLAYHLKVPFRAVGEYELPTLFDHPPRLIMVPSPHNFSRQARQHLFDLAKNHPVTIFWTGPVNLDEYWAEYDSGIPVAETPSSLYREEMLMVEQKPIFFPFDYRASMVGLHGRRQYPGQPTSVHATPLGQGDLLWCPLPIELSSNLEGIAQVYRFALESTQIAESAEWRIEPEPTAVFARRLEFEGKGSLYIVISEAAYPSTVSVCDPPGHLRYRLIVPPVRSVLWAVDEKGQVISIYGPKGQVIETL